ncbi:MAG: Type 1 glutamine amidotransferase-like domain-containing protein [Mycoplasmatota bacterium]
MNKVFITSSVGSSKKVDGKRIPVAMDNSFLFVDVLKKQINNFNSFVMVCGDPKEYDFNDLKFDILRKSLLLSGLEFDNYYLIDYRTDDVESIIKNGSLIYLDGGHPQTQMSYFEEINLREIFKLTNTTIVGNSAGSMNLANVVYCAPEDITQINDERFYSGLGLTDINIEPHFINDESCFSNEEKTLRTILYDDSKKVDIICVTDGSFILQIGDDISYFGDIYTIKDGVKSFISGLKKGGIR